MRQRNRILTAVGTLISVASLAVAGVKLYREIKNIKCAKANRLESGKLDDRLEESFPASDATAVY